MKKKPLALVGAAVTAAAALALLAGCTSDADNVSRNLSTDADNFKVERQIVFYNGITDKYIAEVEGLCSLGNDDSSKQRTVTCKTGPSEYKKHIFGLSDNVTVFALQTKAASEDPYHYKVVFKPETVIPNIEVHTSGGDQ